MGLRQCGVPDWQFRTARTAKTCIIGLQCSTSRSLRCAKARARVDRAGTDADGSQQIQGGAVAGADESPAALENPQVRVEQ